MIDLSTLGYGPFFSAAAEAVGRADLVPARVSAAHRGAYQLLGCRAPMGKLTGRLRHRVAGTDERPSVGDWVLVTDDDDTATIHEMLPRRTQLARRAPGSETERQVLAANLDVVLVVTAAGRDLRVRRLERYTAAVWDGGAQPLVVVNKIDLAEDVATLIAEVESALPAVPILAVSAVENRGMDELAARAVAFGKTVALVGSSGVGKSSIANRLLGGERQKVGEVRDADEKGRHTTTHRELFVLPGGGLLIDTPGLREFGLARAQQSATSAAGPFADIDALTQECRFRDCQHQGEPGCAIAEALARGEIDPERAQSFDKLRREQAYEHRRADPAADAAERKRWRSIHKALKARNRNDPKNSE